MIKKILIVLYISFGFFKITFGQQIRRNFHPDTTFNYSYWNAYADKNHLNPEERAELFSGVRFTELENQYKQFVKDTTTIFAPWNNFPLKGGIGQNQINAGPCTNIDFETNSITGWTATSGFHPAATNPIYLPQCCPTAGAQYSLMTGGTDLYGGFPCVAPGGSVSLRLGNSGTGAQADRFIQTFSVSPASANFTYRYAVVLNDNGHIATQQPRFTAEILDASGLAVNCATYNVVAGSGLQGYFTSSLTANGADVIYKPWTTVALDLTTYTNTNVTIRFTVFDCSQGGHFGYVYIDGFCTNFDLANSATVCPNTSTVFCAPQGFSLTTWNGPPGSGVVNNPSICITPTMPGVYTCTTYLVPGCPGPIFTRTLVNYANPALDFTPTAIGACSNQYTFNSVSSISVGAITNYNWNFGGLGVSSLQNPLFNFPGPGNYPVKFRVTSNQNCKDSVTKNVIVYPVPIVAFSPPSYCINTAVQFSNTSSVPIVPNVPISIVNSYTWNLGNGVFSNLQNPVNTYTSSGNFSVTLTVMSSQGCTATATNSLGIFPPPVLSFSAAPLCDINGTSFVPLTNTAIASGSIVGYFWNFGDGFTSTQQSPVHVYATPGAYTVSYSGTSNHNCVTTVTNALSISPTPTISFNTFSVNACTASQFTFANTSTISAGTISYTWNFGGSNTTTAVNPPTHTFPGIGNYTITLIGMSNLGCADTAVQQLSIYPFPNVTFSVPASCENAFFTCSVTAPSGSVTSYNWAFGDGSPNANVQNPTHVYNATGSYTINLTVTSNLNCISQFSNVINVWPNPVANFTFFPSDACTPNYTFVNSSAVTPTLNNNIAGNLWNFGVSSSTVFTPAYVFPGPGNYTVNLITSTNHNCRDTIAYPVTIYSYPVISFSSYPSCLNVPSTFSPSLLVPPIPVAGTVIAYTWYFGDGNSLNNVLNPVYSYTASGTYPVSFVATSNQGCVSSVSLNVNIYPVPTLSYSANNVCLGNAVTFTNTSTILPPASITEWKWDYENDQIVDAINLFQPSHTYSAAGIYTVELRAKSNNSCMDSLLITVSVHPNPTSSFISSSECLRSSTSFTNLSVPGSTAIVNTLWSFGDGSSSNNPIPVPHIYNQATAYIATLTVTNDLNCSHTSTGIVNVLPIPNVNFSFNETCLGRPTQFGANISVPAPSSVIQWKWDFQNDGVWDLITSTNLNTSFTYTNSGSFNCKLIAITNSQCDSAITKNLVVRANPVANFIAPVICFGNTVTLSNLSGGGDGNITSYKWDFNGDNVIDNQSMNPVTTFTVSGATPVNLIVTTQYGCSDTSTKILFVNPKPVPIFAAPNKSGCPLLCVNFVNTSSIPSGSIVATAWDFGDGSTSTNIQNPSHCFNTGNFNVTLKLTSDSGCVSSLTQPGYVTVYALPEAGFRVEPEQVDEDQPTINVYSAASDAAFIKYYINDGTNYSGANFEHTFQGLDKTKPMIVQVVENANGCLDTTYRVLEIKPAFAIYFPNVFTPNNDGTNDTYQPKGVGILKFNLWIYDRWGHLLFESDDLYNQWDGTVKGGREPIKQDVYIWKSKVVDIFNKTHDYIGHVSLIK